MFYLSDAYPDGALPPKLSEAAYQMQRSLQAPFPMIASSVIACVALAAQRGYLVQRKPGIVYPIGLAYLTIAERSERKTSADRRFLKPINDYEQLLELQTADRLQKWHASKASYTAKKAGLSRAITKLTSKGEDTAILEQQLEELIKSASDKPKDIRFIVHAASADAILNFLKKNGNSCGVMVDEGSVFFNSSAAKHAGLLAKLWGGDEVRLDKTNEESITIRSPRFTMSLLVQPEVGKEYLFTKGKHWRTTGLLSRFLVSYPNSTMGFRHEDVNFPVNADLEFYDKRILDILSSPQCSSKVENVILQLDESARRHLAVYANWVESLIRPFGWFADVFDAASKIAENATRMAAVFHIFEGFEGPISYDTLNRAITVCNWHLSQFKSLFGKNNQLPQLEQDALDIEQCMRDFYTENGHSQLCPKVRISRYSTQQLRKDYYRREAAFQYLIDTKRIQYVYYPNSKTEYVNFLYPQLNSGMLQQTPSSWLS